MARINKVDIKRGDIWAIDLRPGLGSEITKKRPCLVISSDEFNNVSPLVIVLPVSSQIHQISGPERILLPRKNTRLKKDSIILINHIRALDKGRLSKKIGELSEEILREVEDGIKIVLDLDERN